MCQHVTDSLYVTVADFIGAVFSSYDCLRMCVGMEHVYAPTLQRVACDRQVLPSDTLLL